MAVVDLTIETVLSKSFGDLANFNVAHQNTRNFSTIVSRTFTTSSTAKLLAANQYDVMTIPLGAFVKSVSVFVKTATGETSTLDVGDSASDTQFLTAFDLNGAVGTSITTAVTVGKYYAAANKIRLQPNHDLDAAGVFTVVAEFIYAS